MTNLSKNQTPKASEEKMKNWENVLTSTPASSNFHLNFIKYPVVTEKSYIALFKNRQYTFDVDIRLTKTQIQKLFEKLFQVKVIAVNTHIPPRQKLRQTGGYSARYKRVFLTLQEGQKIQLSKETSS